MLKGHLPRVIYHQVYYYMKNNAGCIQGAPASSTGGPPNRAHKSVLSLSSIWSTISVAGSGWVGAQIPLARVGETSVHLARCAALQERCRFETVLSPTLCKLSSILAPFTSSRFVLSCRPVQSAILCETKLRQLPASGDVAPSLVFKAHTIVYHSALGLREIEKNKKDTLARRFRITPRFTWPDDLHPDS